MILEARMPDPLLQRFPCPSCGKVLKSRADWAGRSVTCPACQNKFVVPAVAAAAPSSRTVRQLDAVIGAEDDASLSAEELERAALYFSQATCGDFRQVKKALRDRQPSARQWRKLLLEAADQENMRSRIEDAAQQSPLAGDDDDTPIPLLAAAEDTAPNAWTLLSRFLYYLAHQQCDGCRQDATGLSCIYRSFDAFTEARQITPERAAGWQAAIRQRLGV